MLETKYLLIYFRLLSVSQLGPTYAQVVEEIQQYCYDILIIYSNINLLQLANI